MTVISSVDVPHGARLHARLVVIGAGPAGIVSALEASRRGIDVIVIETGNKKPDPGYQKLSAARLHDPTLHAPVELAVSRQIGGTSSIWGGRCVPYDRVDFSDRKITTGSLWPLGYDDLCRYFERACLWFRCGRAVFDIDGLDHLPRHMIPGLADGHVSTSSLERWSLPTNFGKEYLTEIRDSSSIELITDATCTSIMLDDSTTRAQEVVCKTTAGRSFTVAADDVVVAAGGLESTRLLMCSEGPRNRSLGDHSGHLGHWYMAHLEGVIADLVLSPDAADTIYWYERDIDGTYIRRRFTFTAAHQVEHDLPNVSGWIANPELADASHKNARLSLTYLVLISPIGFLLAPPAQRLSLTGTKIPGTPYGMATRSSIWAHLRNVIRNPVETLRFAYSFGVRRVFARGRKPPGFFVANRANRFPLQYHAEHLPHYESRVRLDSETDELGMPKLDIDIRFTDEDIDGVLTAHTHWDEYLRANGVGRLEYLSKDLRAAVRERTGGGFHQVGTTRMSNDPQHGVVDENLAVHGVPNLHVVSSSVFVTSGQANSTFMIVVFALRLIDHLYGPANDQ